MDTGAVKAAASSAVEEEFPLYFGQWIKHRRHELDLTQVELSDRASCSVCTLRKIESGERKPSRQLAGLLAQALEISSDDQNIFIKAARGELGINRLARLAGDSQPAARPSSIHGNLPRTLTPFIGREPELSALGQLLGNPQCALLTIVGPGGIGKTRLAVEAARHSRDLFPDGTWFVPLAALNSPAQILQAITDALDFKLQDPANPQAQLLRHLRTKRALLVLDNAEHLLGGIILFTEILKDCQQVKLFVTSRERLNLLSEWVFEIQGLPVPASDQVKQMEAYSSVALFLQSARRVQAGFELREAERPWVLKICQTMGGMPLGIELSAAWAGLLSCEEIAREIEHNLDFLSVSMRDLPERHRSLRATLDHSWNLLNPEERLILSRLSVFRGSFRREAAQEICGASLAVLSSLRDKTLLYRTDQEHYALHEVIRQYAELKLAEDPGENERVKDRHASYYVRCLSEWEKAIQSSRQLEIFHEMAQVLDNLSQGWQRMVTQCRPKTGKSNRFSAELLHSSLFSLSLFYEMRCRSLEAIALFTESVQYLKTVQGEFEETQDRTRFNSVLGQVITYLGLHHIYILEYDKAREHLEEALRLLEDNHAGVERAQAQIILAAMDYKQGKLKRSAVLHEQSREVFREAGESWWYLLSLINLARTYLPLGKLQECAALYQEGFRLIEPGDLRLELALRIGFAYLCYLQNDCARAEQLMRDNLELSHRFGNHRVTASIYIHLSQVALSTNRVELAEKYLQEGFNLLSELGESDDVATGLLYLGKCFLIRLDLEAAREKFRQVIKIGHRLNTFYLVYWALVDTARTYMNEGSTEKALEIAVALKDCPVEHKLAQDEGSSLLAGLQAMLPEWQVKAAMQQMESKLSPDHAIAGALDYALDLNRHHL